jgi:Protein of unknown function (DUF2938)
MNIELIYVLIAIAVGFGATLVMDLWGIFLKHTFNIPSPNYCFVGRWLCYMPEGIFRHSSIAAAPQKPAECPVGWIAHYAIGVIFALALVLLASPQWLQKPTVLPAMNPGPCYPRDPIFCHATIIRARHGGVEDTQPYSSQAPKPHESRCVRAWVVHFSTGLEPGVQGLCLTRRRVF